MNGKVLLVATIVLGGGLLAAAACGGSSSKKAAAPTQPEAAATSMPTDAMAMQPGAENMKVAITSPANGTVVTENSVTLQVQASGFEDTCDWAGKPTKEGVGHYHVEIDKALVNMYCSPEATISLQNVKPGTHTLTVIPAQNDHGEVHDNAVSVDIDYEPARPLPEVTDATAAGAPSIKILEPKDGDTVSGSFDIMVQVTNFNLSCDLLGKPAVAGYGHWHLNLDSTSQGMMGMGTMAGMSCEQVFHASTAGLDAGSTHTLIALLLDNGHAPLMPEISDKIEVHIQ